MLLSGMIFLSSGANGIIWDYMLSSGMKCSHLEPMLSSGTTYYHLWWNVIIWDAMLSSGANVIIWDKMLSSKANVIMVSSGANVIIWCYHVMLSSGMITHPFFIFPENFTHSYRNSFVNNESRKFTEKNEFLRDRHNCQSLYNDTRISAILAQSNLLRQSFKGLRHTPQLENKYILQ